ncbi:MAG: M28 family peptidase [Clostridia bacterium]|nr:M28 family peptidase [Clostridia bacterium]
MNKKTVREILKNTDYIRVSGSAEEKQAAAYLRSLCEKLGVSAYQEPFDVDVAEIREAVLTADGREIPCKGYKLCGSGSVEAPLCYLPNTDPASLSLAKGKIVLLDTGITYWVYQDLLDAGAVGFITYDGDVHYPDRDIDQKMLRPYVSKGRKVPCVNINAKDAFRLVQSAPETVSIRVEQTESAGTSQNVIAEIPGRTDEWIVLSAHYDSTPLSRGAYDNMSGCIGLLGIMEALRGKAPLRYGLRFVFCGSEEVGLLGSKAYTAAHEAELEKIALDINLDMIGTYMGRFIACISAENKLLHYLEYLCAQRGWGLHARQDVYSSDSTPFADKGVPALSFARIAPKSQATIHNRYDTRALLSEDQLIADIGFLSDFTLGMADAIKCPVSREIPEDIKTKLDEYLLRKRRKDS